MSRYESSIIATILCASALPLTAYGGEAIASDKVSANVRGRNSSSINCRTQSNDEGATIRLLKENLELQSKLHRLEDEVAAALSKPNTATIDYMDAKTAFEGAQQGWWQYMQFECHVLSVLKSPRGDSRRSCDSASCENDFLARRINDLKRIVSQP